MQLIYSASLLGELLSTLKLATRYYNTVTKYQLKLVTKYPTTPDCDSVQMETEFELIKSNIKRTREPWRYFISTDPLVSSNESCPLCLQVLL